MIHLESKATKIFFNYCIEAAYTTAQLFYAYKHVRVKNLVQFEADLKVVGKKSSG